jgi:hypothetical protein
MPERTSQGCNALCLWCFALGLTLSRPGTAVADSTSEVVLSLAKTELQCELIGLGAIDTVPFNFPGANVDDTAAARAMNRYIVESRLATGGNPDAAAIWGGDLGQPFEHADGKLYFTFGDSLFDGVKRATDPSLPAGTVVNDDLLASVDITRLQRTPACIPLELAIDKHKKVNPITWNGPVDQGGQPLGSLRVPGPGFSTGKHVFMLVPRASASCGEMAGDCAAANGLPTDLCLDAEDGSRRCFFGQCGVNDPSSPCARRLEPSQLLVRRQDSDFTEPSVGAHVVSPRVHDAYRGHFSTVSFFAEMDFENGDGRVWVVGRDSFWATPELKMNPYLMYHPVHQGTLGEPLYFSGMSSTQPNWSQDGADAQPIYEETKLLNNHTSLLFEPDLDGGTWLMLYGGHAQPALKSALGNFIRPVMDDIFYDQTAGVYLRWAKQPWGPWSEPITIFNPYLPGQGGYCETMYYTNAATPSSFQCPQEKQLHNMALNREPDLGMAAEYGAALVPKANHVTENALTLRWLISTWNPYRVIMLESTLDIQRSPTSTRAYSGLMRPGTFTGSPQSPAISSSGSE